MIKAVVTEYKNRILIAVFDADELYTLSLYDADKEPLESVYLCRVTKVLNNIGACFIDYAPGKKGFLKCSGVKPETIIPLQLKKESNGSKEPLFTENITLSSDYAVIERSGHSVNVSSKIDSEERLELKKAFLNLAEELDISIVIRTNAVTVSLQEVEESIRNLNDRLTKIEKDSTCRTLYSVLYRPKAEYIKALMDLRRSDGVEIITDIKSYYDEILDAFSNINSVNVRWYGDEMISLYHLNRLEHYIQNATSRRINLKSGAEICIDVTEALTAIDVNTHHSSSKGDMEATFFDTNMEAAREIIRQLRIRNISGMVIIDFINMKRESNYEALFQELVKMSKSDPAGIKVIDITGLKLVELVRTRKRKSLIDQMR